ncbi:MAG: hypothetical protein E7208_11605 [Clostridium butyricum]|nr:hypothetical protein [Clostridium butyricum]
MSFEEIYSDVSYLLHVFREEELLNITDKITLKLVHILKREEYNIADYVIKELMLVKRKTCK